MASKFFRAFNTIARKLPGNKSKVAPTITHPRQLKTTMKKQYGKKRGETVFYASKNKGVIKGVEKKKKGVKKR